MVDMAGPVLVLYVEELKATMRGRFAWIGAAVVLLAVGGLATVGTQDTWLDGYGIVAYGIAPLLFIPLSAGFIAGARASRFVESVFTAPVRRGDWLAAKVLVLLTLAAGYYVSLVPMLLVYAAHVGAPLLLHKFLWWTPGLLLASVSVGSLIGVLFIGRSVGAPAGAGMGVLLAYAAMIPLQELMVAQANGASRTGHVTLTSPAVLLKNGLGFALAVGSVPTSTAATWVSFWILVSGCGALAAWIFLKAQGVETWETTRRQRWMIGASIIALALAPTIAADTVYEKPAPRQNNAPAIRALFSRGGSLLAMVTPGARMPARCCATILNREDLMAMSTDVNTRRDLLVLLPVDASQRISELHIQLIGEDGLEVTPVDPLVLDHAVSQLETHSYPNDSGPVDNAGRRVTNGWVARVPVDFNPTKPWDIGGDRYPLTVKATYRIGDEHDARTISGRAAIDAQVGPAIYEMGMASSVLPLLCIGAAITRWRRTR
jgi:hypothetical protein